MFERRVTSGLLVAKICPLINVVGKAGDQQEESEIAYKFLTCFDQQDADLPKAKHLTPKRQQDSSSDISFANIAFMQEVDRTVVLIGRTGAGKSSCANALARNDTLFGVSNHSVSMTKYVESHTVFLERSNKTYGVKIVDTIGIGDTDLSVEEVLLRLAEACHECRNGINAIYFVTGGRFTEVEADAYDLLSQVLFGPEVNRFTTIVRTHFTEFNDDDVVKIDQDELKSQQGPAGRIVQQIQNPYIYVDIPPARYRREADTKDSGTLLLDYLVDRCEEKFQPPVLSELKQKVSEHVKSKRGLEERIAALQQQIAKKTAALEQIGSNESNGKETEQQWAKEVEEPSAIQASAVFHQTAIPVSEHHPEPETQLKCGQRQLHCSKEKQYPEPSPVGLLQLETQLGLQKKAISDAMQEVLEEKEKKRGAVQSLLGSIGEAVGTEVDAIIEPFLKRKCVIL